MADSRIEDICWNVVDILIVYAGLVSKGKERLVGRK